MWAFGLIGVSSSQVLNVNIGYSQSAFSFLVTCALLWGALKTVIVVRWCLYWLVMAITLVFFIDGNPDLDKTGFLTSSDTLRVGIFVWLGLMEVLTIFVWGIIHHAYPRVVRDAKWLNVRRWWKIRELPSTSSGKPQETFTYIYRPSKPWPFFIWAGDETRTISYTGELDIQGRPHGQGRWTDTSKHGECLTGVWVHGQPVGPFKSREWGSGYGFVGVRVGYCDCRKEDWDRTNFWPEVNKGGNRWGVVGVECSVSGAFFKDLPLGQIIMEFCSEEESEVEGGEEEEEGGEDVGAHAGGGGAAANFVLNGLIHGDSLKEGDGETNEDGTSQVVVRINEEGLGLNVSGFQSIGGDARRVVIELVGSDQTSTELQQLESGGRRPHLSIPNYTLSSPSYLSHPTEDVLILIPGFNCPLETACNNLAQLLTMGDFPRGIKPVVFGWPCGQVRSKHRTLIMLERVKS